jgi:hypothetical protein
MPLITYEQTRPWAKQILERVQAHQMPPWFSDRCCGRFSTDHNMPPQEIALIEAWVKGGAVEGKKKDARPLLRWTDSWRIDGPSFVVSLPRSFEVPANSAVAEQYVILPMDLAEDRWTNAIEIHPSDRSIVDHAVLYLRTKDSQWLRNVPKLMMYAPPPNELPEQAAAEILAVYTPASPVAVWPSGMGKRLPVGADLVLRIHYTSKKTDATDRTAVGINFLREPPKQRVVTLEMQSVTSGALPRDATLLSIFPYMRQNGAAFEAAIVRADGSTEPLLNIKPFDFRWQEKYPLPSPKLLSKGTSLQITGFFDTYFDFAVDLSAEKLGSFLPPPH